MDEAAKDRMRMEAGKVMINGGLTVVPPRGVLTLQDMQALLATLGTTWFVIGMRLMLRNPQAGRLWLHVFESWGQQVSPEQVEIWERDVVAPLVALAQKEGYGL